MRNFLSNTFTLAGIGIVVVILLVTFFWWPGWLIASDASEQETVNPNPIGTFYCDTPGETRTTARGVEVCNPQEKWELIPSTDDPGEVVSDTVVLTDTKWIDICTEGSNADLQIEPLVENTQVVANSWMALDLNRAEVASGQRWLITVPDEAYVHLFVADTGLTYEVVGPAKTVSTALTVWCQAGSYAANHKGMARVMNAKQLPKPLQDIWMNIPESGIMPIPPAVEAVAPSASDSVALEATAEANPVPAVAQCTAPQGWSKISDEEYHIGPLAADSALKDFTVPTGMVLHYSYQGVGQNPAQAGQVVDLHEGTLFCTQ